MPVISTSMNTCPTTCPFKENGCYGYSLPYMKAHWKKWSNGESGAVDIDNFVKQLEAIPKKTFVRFGEVGDLPGNGIKQNTQEISKLCTALHDCELNAFTYTHYHITSKAEWNYIAINLINYEYLKENKHGLVINYSFEDLIKAKEFALQGRPTTCTIPDDGKTDWSLRENRIKKLGDGVTAIVCPAVWREEIQCVSCGGKNGPLCARVGQKPPYVVICFSSHGNGRKKVNEVCK